MPTQTTGRLHSEAILWLHQNVFNVRLNRLSNRGKFSKWPLSKTFLLYQIQVKLIITLSLPAVKVENV